MKYLAIDTSGDYLSVICRNGEVYKTYYSEMAGVKHSVSLMPAIEETAKNCNLDLKDADFFCSTVGPGSFTGIRIGVATVKGFADAYNKPVLPVTTLEAIAYTENGKRLAVIDAKHDHFYAQGFNGDMVTIQPKFISKEELIDLQKEYKIVANGLIEGFCDKVPDLIGGLINAVEGNTSRITENVDNLHPFYLRLSQAEEGRK